MVITWSSNNICSGILTTNQDGQLRQIVNHGTLWEIRLKIFFGQKLMFKFKPTWTEWSFDCPLPKLCPSFHPFPVTMMAAVTEKKKKGAGIF